jgi:hypothetical protein
VTQRRQEGAIGTPDLASERGDLAAKS